MVIYLRRSRLHLELKLFMLLAFPPLPEDGESNLLFPVRALRIYLDHSASFRQTEQLFVCFGGQSKGDPVTKLRLSRWMVDAISLAYQWVRFDTLVLRPIRLEAWPHRGLGHLGFPFKIFVEVQLVLCLHIYEIL